jgi:hypothetical protein
MRTLLHYNFIIRLGTQIIMLEIWVRTQHFFFLARFLAADRKTRYATWIMFPWLQRTSRRAVTRLVSSPRLDLAEVPSVGRVGN